MDNPPDGSIVITPKEFYDGVSKDIAEIKQAVAPLSGLRTDIEELKQRVRTLELWVWRAAGISAGVGMAASFVVPQLGK